MVRLTNLGIYTQNDDENQPKDIVDNIIFNSYGYGIHAYPNPGHLKGFNIKGNVLFGSGSLSNPDYRLNSILVSAYQPYQTQNITIESNLTYNTLASENEEGFSRYNMTLGCADPNFNSDVKVKNNYLVEGDLVVGACFWKDIEFRDNTIIGNDKSIGLIQPQNPESTIWDFNKYYLLQNADFTFNFVKIDSNFNPTFTSSGNFANWKLDTGFDSNNQVYAHSSLQNSIFIKPNKHESKRATVVVYNWEDKDSVNIDLSLVLDIGDSYKILNVQSLSQPALDKGVYNGNPITLPMKGLPVDPPIGGNNPPSTGSEFNVFLVLPDC